MQSLIHSLMLLLITLFIFIPSLSAAADNEDSKALPSGVREYNLKVSKLNALELRINDYQRAFNALVQAKNRSSSIEEKRKLMDQMVVLSDDRNKAVDEYNELKQELEYRFPDKGHVLNRRYAAMKSKTVKDLMKESDLDEKLSATKQLIDKKYAPFHREAEEEQRRKIQLERQKRKAKESQQDQAKEPEKIKLIK